MLKNIKGKQWEVLKAAYENGWFISEDKLRNAGPEYHLAALKLVDEGFMYKNGNYFHIDNYYHTSLLVEIVERNKNGK